MARASAGCVWPPGLNTPMGGPAATINRRRLGLVVVAFTASWLFHTPKPFLEFSLGERGRGSGEEGEG